MDPVCGGHVRFLDQEVDAVEICPSCPEYMVIGTYTLVNDNKEQTTAPTADEVDAVNRSTATRIGSLQIMPVDPDKLRQPSHYATANLQLRYDTPCALLDIHFCPTDSSLLGAATSIGELRFFRITTSNETRPVPVGIIPLGVAALSGSGSHLEESDPPSSLITQFAWIADMGTRYDRRASEQYSVYYLASCDTNGQAKLLKVNIPTTSVEHDFQVFRFNGDNLLPCVTHSVHKHLYGLEAWTVATTRLDSSTDTLRQILLSGGDDSCLIASTYTLGQNNPHCDSMNGIEFETQPARAFLDKQTHSAGVVSILPLSPLSVYDTDGRMLAATPVLTGSYDQRLRLLFFDPLTSRCSLISELELQGGVWRILLLDSYTFPDVNNSVVANYLFLVSAMHAGCYIIRLTQDTRFKTLQEGWHWKIEAHYSQPHESMVYACAAIRESVDDGHRNKQWQIVSTSFYDKRICLWRWTDDVARQME